MDYIWVVILLMAVFSLPDILRRKRRYPTRKKPLPGPGETRSEQRQEPRHEGPGEIKSKPAPEKKTPQPVQSKPVPQPAPKPVPLPRTTVSMPVPGTAAMRSQSIRGAVLPAAASVQERPWCGIAPEARDIYAGLVWSELLQPPLALRKHRNTYFNE